MIGGIFNRRSKPPSPAEIKAFCTAATRPDDAGQLTVFIEKFGKEAVDSVCPETGYTALMRAAQTGETRNCQHLLAYGANINAQDKDGWTPLITAVNQNRRETIETLLLNNADINLANNNKMTPLMTAAREGNVDLVKLLLEKGADPLLKNMAKQNASTVARSYTTGPNDVWHKELIVILDAAVAKAEKAAADAVIAANMAAAVQVADSLMAGTDKPVNVSRPLTFKN